LASFASHPFDFMESLRPFMSPSLFPSPRPWRPLPVILSTSWKRFVP
jgi:hypothetical protein